MNSREAERLARRLALLELEAQVQRASLAATIAHWESRRTLAWAASASTMVMRLLAVPRVRWLIIASLLTRLKARRDR